MRRFRNTIALWIRGCRSLAHVWHGSSRHLHQLSRRPSCSAGRSGGRSGAAAQQGCRACGSAGLVLTTGGGPPGWTGGAVRGRVLGAFSAGIASAALAAQSAKGAAVIGFKVTRGSGALGVALLGSGRPREFGEMRGGAVMSAAPCCGSCPMAQLPAARGAAALWSAAGGGRGIRVRRRVHG